MSRRYPARLLRLGHKDTVAGQRLEPAKDEARAKAKTRSPGKDRTRQRRGPRMYEMQGPRQTGQRYPPIAPAGWFAGAIGDPHAVRPTTGPGHLARVPVARSPSPNPALLLDPRGCPQVTQSLLLGPRFPSGCKSRPEPPGASSRSPRVTPRTPEVSSEWYPFSLVEKFYSHHRLEHKWVRRTFS
jgi:hypothetical protein